MADLVVPGDVLAGKYRVLGVIAQGGMGVVVAATHVALEQPVALKLMLPEVMGNAAAVARFQREARTVARLRSEHVARILDVGQLDSGVPFIAMEYLEGSDLGVLFSRGVEISLRSGVDWILQAAEAVAEAHALGIVHRDLKPENLFVTSRPDGTRLVKVLDFGISKVESGRTRDHAMTTTQEIMGSPAYMSPEQLVSTRDVDRRADIWSLGAILYELAAGRPAFSGDTLVQLCAKVMHEPHPPLRERCLGLPDGYEEVVDRCLAKDRSLRYGSIAALALALAPFAPERSRPTLLQIQRHAGGTPELAPLDLASELDSLRHPPRVHPASASQRRSTPPGTKTGLAWGDERRAERGAMAAVVVGAIALAGTAAYAAAHGQLAALASLVPGREQAAAEPPPPAIVAAPTQPPEPTVEAPTPEPSAPEPVSTAEPAPAQRAVATTRSPPRSPMPRAAPARPRPAESADDAPWTPSPVRAERTSRPADDDLYSVRK